MIDSDTLKQLLVPVDCGISIYLAIDPTQRDERAPAARLRNVIDAAAGQLEQIDMPPEQRGQLLDTLRGFADSTDFARHRDPGLALFVAAPNGEGKNVWVIPLPTALDELVVVGHDFHIKPLLPLIAANQRFGILALSKANVRLLSATPFTWHEVPLEELPVDAQAELDSRPVVEAAPGSEAAEEMHKELLVASTRNIATAVRAALKDDPAPVVLVADPGVAGSFLQQMKIRQIYSEPLHMNPFALTDQELHAKVLEVMRPVLDTDLEAVLEQITARLGTGEPTVAIRLEEIVAAGREGRIDTVVVAEDEPLWGGINSDGTLLAHGTPRPLDEDLLNLAAIHALRNGGHAFAVPRQRIPRQVPAAAILRF